MSEKMYELRDILCEELDKIADRGELSAGELETAHKLTDTIKNIDKICMMEESGYSGDGEWEAMGSYNRGNSSYRGQNRDSMGRYSRNNGGGNNGGNSYRRGRSYGGRYSMAGEMDNITSQIEELMNSGNLTASQKQTYKKALDMMTEA